MRLGIGLALVLLTFTPPMKQVPKVASTAGVIGASSCLFFGIRALLTPE